MARVKNSAWGIFFESMKLYFANFVSFFKYLAFPVLGQILGIFLILVVIYFYVENIPKLIGNGGFFDNFAVIFLVLLLITLPGLFILIKAFWDYMIAYGAINSMTENMLKSGKVYDFAAHNELITRRTPSFVALWLLFGIFSLIGMCPLFWIIAGVLFIYFILIFQVFTFEPDKSPVGCFQKSMNIIKGNFARTSLLMLLVGGLTYWILPDLTKYIFDFLNLTSFLSIPLDGWAQQFPIDNFNEILKSASTPYQVNSLMIAKSMVEGIIGYIVICFTLPLRSICFTLWYKNLNKGEMKLDKKILDRAEGKA